MTGKGMAWAKRVLSLLLVLVMLGSVVSDSCRAEKPYLMGSSKRSGMNGPTRMERWEYSGHNIHING